MITWVTALSISLKLSHVMWGHPRWQAMVERSDRMWSTGEGNGRPLQYSCLENPMNSMKRQKGRTLKDELTRSISAVDRKRCTTWELCVKFYLGQNEDCSPGGSISDSSERLLQSGSRGRQYIRFGEGGVEHHEALMFQRLFVLWYHEDLMSPWRDLDMRRCKVWDHKICS